MATARKTAKTAEQKEAAAEVSVYEVLSPLRWGKAPDDELYTVGDQLELTAAEAESLPPGHVKPAPG